MSASRVELLQLAENFWVTMRVMASVRKKIEREGLMSGSCYKRVVYFLGLFGFEEREWNMKELTFLLRKKVVGLIRIRVLGFFFSTKTICSELQSQTKVLITKYSLF